MVYKIGVRLVKEDIYGDYVHVLEVEPAAVQAGWEVLRSVISGQLVAASLDFDEFRIVFIFQGEDDPEV